MELPSFLGGGNTSAAPYVVSFQEIVEAHARAKDESNAVAGLSSNGSPGDGEELQALWQKFAEREGEVLSSFFGESRNTGAALTAEAGRERNLKKSTGRPARRGRPRLHVALDLATAGDAADLVSRYERIRVKADQLLKGAEREHVTRVLYDRLCRVIRIVDQMVALDRYKANPRFESFEEVFREESPATPAMAPPAKEGRNKGHRTRVRGNVSAEVGKRISNALTVANAEAAQAEELCNRAVRRGAMMAYFVGMLIGVIFFSAFGAALGLVLSNVDIPDFDVESFLTVFIAGAVGAIVSVMTRMSSGDLSLELETARSYLRLLGMFRPLIGAIFGVALYFGIESGILQFINPPDESGSTFFFFAFIAFLAGFSERWASDVLLPIKGAQEPVSPPAAKAAQPPPPGGA